MLRDGIYRIPTTDCEEIIDLFVKIDDANKIIKVLSRDGSNTLNLSFENFDEFVAQLKASKEFRNKNELFVNIFDRTEENKKIESGIVKVTDNVVNTYEEVFNDFLNSNPMLPDQYIAMTLSIVSSFTTTVVGKMIAAIKTSNHGHVEIEKTMETVFKKIIFNLIENYKCDCPEHQAVLH